MIEIKNLKTGYHVSGHEKIVGDDLNAELRKGELTCLIGPNGSGKSTLLRTIASFMPKLGGEILIDGRNLEDFSASELSRLISIVLTDNSSIHNLSVFDVVSMGRMPYTGFWGYLNAHDRKIVDDCLEMVGVKHLALHMIDALSDGERQKVMIAKAIAQQTPIILLDEPTAFLYYPNKVAVVLLLRKLAHEMNKTILLSIHDIDIALQIADNIWMIEDDGRLVVGNPTELCDSGVIAKHIVNENIEFDKEGRTFYVKAR